MTTTGTWYPPSLGTGGFLHEGQLFTNPPFKMTTPSDATLLRQRLQDITDQRTIMRIIAHQILERHHQASAREIAHLLLDAAGVEVGL
jgi:hypothetical protein